MFYAFPVSVKKKPNAGPGLDELLVSPRPEEGVNEPQESAVGGGSHWNTNRSEAEKPV